MVRPRSTDVDDAIHDATLTLLAESGFARLTVEGVARRAGVGKAAVYRRYASKDDVVAGAVEARLPLAEPRAGGDLRGALRGIVEDLRAALVGPHRGMRLLAALLDESHDDPRLLATWRRRVVEPRVALIARALPDTAAIDARAVGELALGGLVGRYVSAGELTRADGERLADTLWRLVHPDLVHADAHPVPPTNAATDPHHPEEATP